MAVIADRHHVKAIGAILAFAQNEVVHKDELIFLNSRYELSAGALRLLGPLNPATYMVRL